MQHHCNLVPSRTQLYVGLFPCNECAKLIIQSGIQEIVYLSDKYHNTNAMKASRRMLRMAAVRLHLQCM